MNDAIRKANKGLLVSLSRVFQLMQVEFSRLVRADGLTPSQWDALAVLHTRGPQSVNGLIDLCLTSSGNIDVVLRNLVSKGLVTKAVDEHDARCRVIAITEAGSSYVQSAMPAHEETHEKLFGVLSLSEKKELRRLLKKITAKE